MTKYCVNLEACATFPEAPEIGESREVSDDIAFGAYLMINLKHHCEHCGTQNTPQWRKGWFSDILNRSVLLCNACGLKYHKNQFCPYCNWVYGKEPGKPSEGLWISCCSCQRRVHKDCELQGKRGRTVNNEYQCPDCCGKSPPPKSYSLDFQLLDASVPTAMETS